MSKVLGGVSGAWVWAVVAAVGCKQAEQGHQANTSPAASAQPPAASSQGVALPDPGVPVEPVTFQTAHFEGTTLQMCIQATYQPELVAAKAKAGKLDELKRLAADTAAQLAQGKPDVTVLKQPCDSLGQPALTTCTTPGEKVSSTTYFYEESLSDEFMADCVKKGGTWSRNASPEADLQRAQQKLKKLEGK